MAKIRDIRHDLVEAINRTAVKDGGDHRRDHLGASLLGHRCDRYLWLVFRWAFDPKHTGTRLRLFARGQREEDVIVAALRRIGLEVEDVDPETGEQWLAYIGEDGHVGGHLDGYVTLPGGSVPVLECKTHNKKSYDRVVEKGVRASKPEHWAQCQLYMKYGPRPTTSTLYVAVCKDTDELHIEIIELDDGKAVELAIKGGAIVDKAVPPDRMKDKDQPPCVYTSKDGTKWPCDAYELCWGKQMPERNCRTCAHSSPEIDGSWSCAETVNYMTGDRMRVGCDQQQSIPHIVNAQVAGIDDKSGSILYQFDDGTAVEEVKGCN
jgi:hypothetical protein